MKFRIVELGDGSFVAEYKTWGRWQAIYSDGRLSRLPTKHLLECSVLRPDITTNTYEKAERSIARAKQVMSDSSIVRIHHASE